VIAGVADFRVGYAPLFFGEGCSAALRNNSGNGGLARHLQSFQTEEPTMNWDRVEGNWKEFKGKAQTKWGKLTNDDLDVVEGKRQELAGRLQQRYGYAKDQAEKEIDTWLKNVA
jgi:uncharacterized protein YjbJ (UPF0337 family)